MTDILQQWLAELGGVFYSVKEKGYSQRERRVTELEFNRRMEIEAQIAADRERATADKQREQERNDPSRRKREVEVGSSVVRRPGVGARRIGGITASSLSSGAGAGAGAGRGGGGGSVVKRPQVRKRGGRAF